MSCSKLFAGYFRSYGTFSSPGNLLKPSSSFVELRPIPSFVELSVPAPVESTTRSVNYAKNTTTPPMLNVQRQIYRQPEKSDTKFIVDFSANYL